LAAAAFEDWNPAHFIDVAEMTVALSVGYDWLRDDLSDADGETLVQAIIEKGLKPSFAQPHGWIKATNNWNQVCHAGMVMGALAIADADARLCARTVKRAIQNVPIAMEHYAPDGAYPEGPMYWSYGTSFNVMLIAALESAMGSDFGLASQPGFLGSADYFLHVTGPSGKFFNYADCREGGGYAPSVALFWMAAKRGEPSLLYHQRISIARALRAGTARCDQESERLSPLMFLWATGPERPSAPTKIHYVGRGAMPIATHRSSWDDDATFVAIKGGSPALNHAHMDVGSFVLENQGVRWAVDLGMQEYHSLESIGVNLWDAASDGARWSVFRLGSKSHNIVTVDDQGQTVDGRASIVSSTSSGTVVDCAGAYSGQLRSMKRFVHLRSDGSVRIQDDVESLPDRGATVRWSMLTRAHVAIQADGSALLTQDGKRLRLEAFAHGDLRLKTFMTNPAPRIFDAPNPGVTSLGWSQGVPSGTAWQCIVEFHPVLNDEYPHL
jgi:hypothetical protein